MMEIVLFLSDPSKGYVMRSRLIGLLVVAACFAGAQQDCFGAGRHYYSSWNYYPQRTYYYVNYYYKPTVASTDYSYHYCIYYPSAPRYVYYYNPYTRHYWGRYDIQEKGY